MRGHYRRTTQEEELARLYHIPIPKQTDLPISYNIAPSQKVLTIRFNPENPTAIARRPAVGINSLLNPLAGSYFAPSIPANANNCAF